jgi:hypothetical protein
MDRKTDTLTSALDRDVARKIRELAMASGVTTHALTVQVLTDYANSKPRPAVADFSERAVACYTVPAEPFSVNLALPLAMRLHSAAKYVRQTNGMPMPPSILVRDILSHVFGEKTDIIERIQAIADKARDNTFAFTGRVVTRAGVDWHLQTFTTSYTVRNAIHEAAHSRGKTISDVVRKVLDVALPPALEPL